jgi:Ni/Co efflux regulator RcnB
MKKLSVSVCALLATALLGSSLSFAHGRDEEERHGRHHGGRHGEDWRDDQREGRWNDRRPDYNARGPMFYRGGYLPREYRGPAYVVDYREYRLSPPPRGHRWVQVGADYVLIAIATGVIANIILNN